jgi:hypothetical protein
MLTNDNSSKTVFYVKTNIGTYGPYASRNLAEMAIATNQVPYTPGTPQTVMERTEGGQEILFG